ncbi:hypothetical protein FB451DRAFT_1240818 [Mycena latifolia]|nr:hypothetical protein FB451DRAFT_1240818 [Mycena latifolia]
MYHPLTRQPTGDSLRSWWSDRNPLGPSMDLHAAAKPLMRFMYRRDALAFIAKTRGTPLSSENMEIYSSYLAYNMYRRQPRPQFWWSSRQDSNLRTTHELFRIPLCSNSLTNLFTRQTQRSANGCAGFLRCWLGVKQQHRLFYAGIGISLAVSPDYPTWNRLGLEISDEDLGVVKGATEALWWIAKWPEGAQAAVDANVLDSLAGLFDSPIGEVQDLAFDLQEQLASQETTARAVVRQLIPLLRGGDPIKILRGGKILERVATSPGGLTAVDVHMRECVSELLRVYSNIL